MMIYYAHCQAIYNTPQEQRDLALLKSLGFTVINPNTPAIDAECAAIRTDITALRSREQDGHLTLKRRAQLMPFKDAGEAVMTLVFKPLVAVCHALAFRALPDGRIPAGVAQEMLWFQGGPILELPSNVSSRVISVEATREYLLEIGQR